MLKSVSASICLAGLVWLAGAPATAGDSYRLVPYKDRLFGYAEILDSSHGGDLMRVDYDEMRDINGRDEIPEKKVRNEYVSLKPGWAQKTRSISVGGRTLKYVAVGRTDGQARAIVVYVHGRGGSRHQGVNDWTFGGNFNRIKNLMLRSDGVYLSPDFSDFGRRGKDEIKALIREYVGKSPRARVFIACGSMGGEICWRFLDDPESVYMLNGLMFMGTARNDNFFSSPAFKSASRKIPIYFGHGTRDSVFPWQAQLSFFEKIKKLRPDYPVRLVLFETGSHGTPIRMTDWRGILNWMLSVGG